MRSAELTCPHCHHTIELSVQEPSTERLEVPSIPLTLTPRAHARVASSSIPVFVSFPPELPKSLVRSAPPVIYEREPCVQTVTILRSVRPVAVAAQATEKEVDVSLEVTPESEHNFYVGFSSNISEGGLFVATYSKKEVGETLSIRFTLPGDDEPINATTEVRWVREHNEQSDVGAGLGLRFIEISEDAKERIRAFCEHAKEPLFYPEDSLYPPRVRAV